MYHEIAYYNTTYTKDDIIKLVFEAVEKKINGIAIYPYYISSIANYLPLTFNIASPVDFPLGNSDTKIRQHQVISNINAGANIIDLALNNIYLVNNRKLFVQDLKGIKSICDDKSITLRVFYEYRHNYEKELFIFLKNTLVDLKIDYVFPSTGQFVDNYADNILVAKAFSMETKLKPIVTGNIFTKQQYEVVKESEVFGIRFTSNQAYANCLGV
jgi:deoxyribose-phosphate aldolase